MNNMPTADDVISYWRSIGPKGWFVKSDEIDHEIRERFGELHSEAAAGRMQAWRGAPLQCLALIIVLDQFSRNMFRSDRRAFAQDTLALEIAGDAIDYSYDRRVDKSLAVFFYMPFMHSESILDQDRCVQLLHAHGGQENLKFALIHREVIARFGRFPHRNPVLNRHTTPAEQDFLDAGGFSA